MKSRQELWDERERLNSEIARMAPAQIKELKEKLAKWCAILKDDGSDQQKCKAENEK
jgi:hypothetical protein